MSAQLNLVFLGCGAAAALHSRTLASLEKGVRLHFASRDGARAAAFKDQHGGAGSFGSYEEAVGAPGIDAVVVVTPPSSHLELTLAALEAGKNVIVEKPAFLRPKDFGPVREAMARSGRRVMVAENYFYKPLRTRLQEILTGGAIGEPLFLHLNAEKRQVAEGWRADAELAGGGGLFEGGIHWINFMANLGLEVEEVEGYRAGQMPAGSGSAGAVVAAALAAGSVVAAGGPALQGRPQDTNDAEESILVVFRYAGGAVGTLSFSWEVPSVLKGVRISRMYGKGGSVTFESNGIFALLKGSRTRLYLPGFRDLAGYRAMFTDFLGALREDREPDMTLDMAEQDVMLVRKVYYTLGES